MKFTLRKSSDWEYEETVEINNLESLLKFSQKCGHGLIVGSYDDIEWKIEIYDGYRE